MFFLWLKLVNRLGSLLVMTGFELEYQQDIPLFIRIFNERYELTCRNALDAEIKNTTDSF